MSTPTIMIRLGTDGWVNATEVESVRVGADRRTVFVRMKNSEVHSVAAADALRTAAALVEQIDHALLVVAGALPLAETKFKPAGG